MQKTLLLIALCMTSHIALADDERAGPEETYTLYRSGMMNGPNARVHIATFDAKQGAAYNSQNCEIAKMLFTRQNSDTSEYWCEQGYFSKR